MLYQEIQAINEYLEKKRSDVFYPEKGYRMYTHIWGLTKWSEGKIYKFSLPSKNVFRKLEMTVTLLCPDPFLRSYDNFGKNIASVIGMCAFPYLCSISPSTPKGITGGKFNFAKKVLLDNDGDVATYCKTVIAAKGEVVNPKIMIDENYVRVFRYNASG